MRSFGRGDDTMERKYGESGGESMPKRGNTMVRAASGRVGFERNRARYEREGRRKQLTLDFNEVALG